ncbi:MAG: hypothetical protein IIY81_01840, partial [Lachnospiraceae bacterium]|nr:hypothetical protein [Lachnospiraceae bacterium]
NFDPQTAWGGTWQLIVEGQVLLSAGSNYAAGNSYGENSHTITINEMPKHSHEPLKLAYGEPSTNPKGLNYGSASVNEHSFGWLAEVGGSQPMSLMQKSIAVYIWKRTA